MTTQPQQTDPSIKSAALSHITNYGHQYQCLDDDVFPCSDKPRFISPDNARQLEEYQQQFASAEPVEIFPQVETDSQLKEKFPEVKSGKPANDIPEKLPELEGKSVNDNVEKFPQLQDESIARQLPSNSTEVPGNQTLQEELNLISVCQEIGGIAESNNHYTLSLTLHINKPIESLTVAQLLQFHRECNQRFNQGVNHA
ncbi:MAG: hypothetical protein KZQ83_15920 [gamma proteobacterium symbiont of Taylorina sp.]|nr:hypothetical protein [gamma proteobacterium symbiont of Taylorina sp.]